MDQSVREACVRPAQQQPDWGDNHLLAQVREELAARPPLVSTGEVRRLRSLLAEAAAGRVNVLQAGDCAEDPAETSRGHVMRKAAALDLLAGALKIITRKPVIRVGRIAGQFAKPRSSPVERVDGRDIPSFRGHLVNSPVPRPAERRHDPKRMLHCHDAADDIMQHFGVEARHPAAGAESPMWASHEALVLDYEVPQVRRDPAGGRVLTSTHWPWIGERTRQPDGSHVALLSLVTNPVACKVGPGATTEELLALCERIDPHREPGRLTLIARMGAATVAQRLPGLVRAVRDAGHPVCWLTDPMHGNTVTTDGGRKTRFLTDVCAEVAAFVQAVRSAGGVAAGLHLEVTPDDVTECVTSAESGPHTFPRYTTHCDPRLNPDQAASVISAWKE
ncbi:3-deoxy-7-phosphoheptulonate synthase [Streptomyces sodiiphilus]|uniref:Phospho-2-dehydro-3-deoxyheptonate aldolase n=1 Tax=Streptomyces sodiiphilus TaxID=226217 RepID=A0ABN2P3A2_9ACTN